MRAFVALELAEDLRERLAEVGRSVTGNGGGTPVRPAALHLTLRFLGEIGEAEAVRVTAALGVLAVRPRFVLAARGLGAFPAPRAARVLWAGVGEGADAVRDLAAVVTEVTRFAPGPGRDENPYVPHLTLARFRAPRDLEKVELFRRSRETEWGACGIERVVLVRSQLSGEGPRYDVLGDVAFAPGR